MYVHSTIVTNWQDPGAESPGSKLPATPAPPALEHSHCECSRAPKNRLAQKCDCREMLKIQRARRKNKLKHLLCTLLLTTRGGDLPPSVPTCLHTGNVVNTARGAKVPVKPAKNACHCLCRRRARPLHIGKGTRRKEQDENQPQDPESTPSCRDSKKFFQKPPRIS